MVAYQALGPTNVKGLTHGTEFNFKESFTTCCKLRSRTVACPVASQVACPWVACQEASREGAAWVPVEVGSCLVEAHLVVLVVHPA